MGLQHLQFPVVRQGSETMACWAACLSWYGKAVRNLNFTMHQVAEMYKSLMAPPESGSEKIGGMNDYGRQQIFMDAKWRLNQTGSKRNGLTMNLIDMYLESSPTIICYWDPKLGKNGGSHVNVIVARVPLTDSHFFVMDPDYSSFQIRNLQYYSEKSQNFHLASLRGY